MGRGAQDAGGAHPSVPECAEAIWWCRRRSGSRPPEALWHCDRARATLSLRAVITDVDHNEALGGYIEDARVLLSLVCRIECVPWARGRRVGRDEGRAAGWRRGGGGRAGGSNTRAPRPGPGTYLPPNCAETQLTVRVRVGSIWSRGLPRTRYENTHTLPCTCIYTVQLPCVGAVERTGHCTLRPWPSPGGLHRAARSPGEHALHRAGRAHTVLAPVRGARLGGQCHSSAVDAAWHLSHRRRRDALPRCTSRCVLGPTCRCASHTLACTAVALSVCTRVPPHFKPLCRCCHRCQSLAWSQKNHSRCTSDPRTALPCGGCACFGRGSTGACSANVVCLRRPLTGGGCLFTTVHHPWAPCPARPRWVKQLVKRL